MSESDGGLRSKFREKLPQFHWQSIETGGTGQGIPDSNFCFSGVEGWVEFKQTDGWAVTLKPEQVGWHMRRARSYGRTYIAVRRWHDGGPRLGRPVDELWLCRGAFAKDLKLNGLRGCDRGAILGVWSGGPAAWGWDEVAALLVGDTGPNPTAKLDSNLQMME